MLDQFIPTSCRKNAHDNEEANKSLVVSILWQAYQDAISKNKANNPLSARHFIDKNNPLFIHYCELLEFDPDWMADNMQKKIAEHDQRKNNKSLKRAYI